MIGRGRNMCSDGNEGWVGQERSCAMPLHQKTYKLATCHELERANFSIYRRVWEIGNGLCESSGIADKVMDTSGHGYDEMQM